MPSTPNAGTRAAASSIASGMPSSRRQMRAATTAWRGWASYPGSAACARTLKSLTAPWRDTSSTSTLSSTGTSRDGTR